MYTNTENCIWNWPWPYSSQAWHLSPRSYSWSLMNKLMSCSMTKPRKWFVRPAKTKISLDIRPVWAEYSLCAQWVANDSRFLQADSEDSDQSGRTPRLIWVFAGRTSYFVGFVVLRLIYRVIFQAGDYPLHIAVRHCHLYVVKELLEYIANQWSKVDAYMLVNGANTVQYIKPMKGQDLIILAVYFNWRYNVIYGIAMWWVGW